MSVAQEAPGKLERLTENGICSAKEGTPGGIIQLLVGNETEFLTLDFPAECRITVLLEDN